MFLKRICLFLILVTTGCTSVKADRPAGLALEINLLPGWFNWRERDDKDVVHNPDLDTDSGVAGISPTEAAPESITPITEEKPHENDTNESGLILLPE